MSGWRDRLARRSAGAAGRRSAAALLAALVVGVSLAAIAALGMEVARKLDALETARADNVEWALSQAEVELLRLQSALLDADTASPAELAPIRRRFDIFFSRIEMLDKGPIYGLLAEDADYARRLATVREFLDGAVPLIDGPDPALAAARDDLARRVAALHEDLRALSLGGVARFAAEADLQREAVADMLLALALLAGLLIAGLAALLAMLLGLYRLSQRRARTLEVTSNRLSTVVASTLDAVVIADREGRLVDINPAGERIFGYARAEAVGERLSDLIVPDLYRAAHEAGLRRYRESGARRMIGAGRVQMTAQRRSGEVFPAEISVQTAETEQGEVFVAFLRDISERKRAEGELRAARDRARAGERAKTEFLAMMSHEMRTPLNGLIGTLGLLRATGLGPDQRRHVENMEASGQLLLSHITDVLDISRFEAGRVTLEERVFDPAAILREIVDSQQSVAAEGRNRLDWEWMGAPVPRVRGDPAALRRVLVNLVGNALKFTRAGRVTVEAECLSRRTSPARFEIRVIDTGIGIAEERLARIFDDFEMGDSAYDRRAGGTGLGLGIARRMAEAMGGEIGAESEEGEGSLFWLRVPFEIVAAEAVPEIASPPEHAPSPPAAALDILVVEDNRINREVLGEMLRIAGHRVSEAADGAEGVRRAAGHRFDVILMDISMPGMDGLAATRCIREGGQASADVPIVAVTAHAMPAEIARFRAAGMTGHLIKPISLAALTRVLGEAGPPAQGGDGAALPPPTDEPPLVDAAQRAALTAQIGVSTRDRLEARFLAETGEVIAALDAAQGGDLEQTVRALHQIAGTAGTFGAARLRAQIHEMERAGKAGDRAGMLAGRARLLTIWQETRAAFGQPVEADTDAGHDRCTG